MSGVAASFYFYLVRVDHTYHISNDFGDYFWRFFPETAGRAMLNHPSSKSKVSLLSKIFYVLEDDM